MGDGIRNNSWMKHMKDFEKVSDYIEGRNVTVTGTYRYNFDAARSCGAITVYNGKNVDGESFEVYSELLECGLDEEKFKARFKKVCDEIESGKLDVSF
ncbi:MAG: hypothetical protein AMDU5_GPLC00005G0030 [Thermoplasmatales archaeon Gpl]|jgi:hypothetical protein|nr:MAG: hypothetical protein AMDU5_GPLC00005G0030 [Thermoplasmatales archaeon Gpl]